MVAPIPGAEMCCEFGTPGRRWRATYHTGRDYRAAVGTEVRATMAGTVISVARERQSGLCIVIETGDIRHLYAHLSKAVVGIADRVEAGQVVGLTGAGHRGDEPHLHYEERVSPYGDRDHRWPMFDTVERDGSAIQEALPD